VLTTNLPLVEYSIAFAGFVLAPTGALVVGKSVLVANAMPFLRRYDRGPLIWPILFKMLVDWAVVFVARRIRAFLARRASPGRRLPAAHGRDLFLASICHDPDLDIGSVPYLCDRFRVEPPVRRWRIAAHPVHLPAVRAQLNRRQRIRELVRLSDLADAHSVDEFRDPASAAHHQLVDIVWRLAR
jgi:hypothetical protein